MIVSLNFRRKKNKKYPILCQSVCYNHIQEHVDRHKGMKQFQFFYTVSGSGEFSVNGQRMICKEGQSVLLYPFEAHSYKAITSEWKVHILMISGICAKEIITAFGFKQSSVYNVSDKNLFEEYITKLLAVKDTDDNFGDENSRISYDFLLSFSNVTKRTSTLKPTSQNGLISDTVDYIEAHFKENISIDQIASAVGVTKEYLCYVFKREMGQTIVRFLTSIRLGYAKELLEEYPDKKACEVAKLCGYESASYFGKVFKENIGVTPDEYRRIN